MLIAKRGCSFDINFRGVLPMAIRLNLIILVAVIISIVVILRKSSASLEPIEWFGEPRASPRRPRGRRRGVVSLLGNRKSPWNGRRQKSDRAIWRLQRGARGGATSGKTRRGHRRRLRRKNVNRTTRKNATRRIYDGRILSHADVAEILAKSSRSLAEVRTNFRRLRFVSVKTATQLRISPRLSTHAPNSFPCRFCFTRRRAQSSSNFIHLSILYLHVDIISIGYLNYLHVRICSFEGSVDYENPSTITRRSTFHIVHRYVESEDVTLYSLQIEVDEECLRRCRIPSSRVRSLYKDSQRTRKVSNLRSCVVRDSERCDVHFFLLREI